MTELANHAGNDPWPSLDAASRWFDRASIVLAISLLFGAAATATIVWLGIVKEHHWDLLRERSSEKVAGLELETAKAKAELGTAQADIAKANAQIAGANEVAAKAHERAAALENDAAQARAEQERLKAQLAWRRLTKDAYDRIVSAAKAIKLDEPLLVFSPLGDPEAATLAADIIKALKAGSVAIQNDGASAGVFNNPPMGIILAQPGSERVPHPVAQVLINAGLFVTIELNSPDLKLIVGSRPSPF